jgi:exodeoxyribonuclease-3
MRIATFNINGIKARLPALLHWLEHAHPDVVCLQELKSDSPGVLADGALAALGYYALWHGQKAWNGVAILARGIEPIKIRRELPGDTDDAHARYLEAAVGGVIVAALYLPNGNPQPGPKFQYKLAWFERLVAHAQGLRSSGHPVVLAGDFNVVPTDLDIYSTASWKKDALLQPESRAAFARLLDAGWTDALRHCHPDDPALFTFWDYMRKRWERNAGLRIDHLLLSPAAMKRLQGAGVDREVRGWPKASDHAPVWVEMSDK